MVSKSEYFGFQFNKFIIFLLSAINSAELIADNKKIINLLNWKPKYSDLETIVKSAWNWEKKVKIK